METAAKAVYHLQEVAEMSQGSAVDDTKTSIRILRADLDALEALGWPDGKLSGDDDQEGER